MEKSPSKRKSIVGGRGKAGGIKLAETPEAAEAAARQILGMDIKGLTVEKVLDRRGRDLRERTLPLTDSGPWHQAHRDDRLVRGRRRRSRKSQGRIPMRSRSCAADPMLGLQAYQARDLAFQIGLTDAKQVRQFASIAMALYQIFVDNDASLVEINPLVIKADGSLLALDSKILIDDSGLFRHPDLAALRDTAGEPEAELKARDADLTFIKLDGDIGCMVNGAGLAMATMDVINLYGGSPANFLDIGGGANARKVAAALDIILSDQNVKAVLINIFGGITRGDEVARGIVEALGSVSRRVPMVVRLVGTNAEEGARILADADLIPASSLGEAAQKVVAVSQA